MKHGKTESFEEALEWFKRSPRIMQDKDLTRAVGDELIMLTGSTTSGEAIAEANRRGLLDMTKKQHWAGSLFRDYRRYEKVSDKKEKGAGHDDLAHRWRFTPAYKAYLSGRQQSAA